MDPSHSCPLESGDVDIEPREFATRHEFASYLDGCLSRAGIQHEIDEEGMWEWLSLFYFDSVCPPNSSGMRIPGDEKRHILRVSGGQRPHRHLLRDPYLLHKQYCEAEAGLTDLLLCSPLAHPSDLTENISARRRIRNSPGALGAARRLFFDEKTRVAKRGTAAAEGSHKKFCVWLQNLPSHLDVSSLSSDTLIALMPPEFDKWLPHTELENLAENREMLRSSTNQNPLLERIDHASSAVSLAEVLGNFEDRVLTANQRVVRADAFRQGVLKAYGFHAPFLPSGSCIHPATAK